MKKLSLLLALFMSCSSFASIDSAKPSSFPVNQLEVIYECDGLLPNVTALSGTKVIASGLGEIQLPKETIVSKGYEVFFQKTHIGTVNDSPRCLMKSTKNGHDLAEPSANKIELDPGIALTLSSQQDGSYALSIE